MFRLFDYITQTFILDFFVFSNGAAYSLSDHGLFKFENAYISLFSELYDKNKKPIYEGDLVKFYYKGKNVICEIVLHKGVFCLKWQDGYINHHPMHTDNYEIVGNIFLNPKALKEQAI